MNINQNFIEQLNYFLFDYINIHMFFFFKKKKNKELKKKK
jgi:hypothetical protein